MAIPASTLEVKIPTNPLEQVIGQEEAVRIAQVAARQRRHLLLVGPPGTGKSMIAQAIAHLIPRPKEEVSVIHNPEIPERPQIEVRHVELINVEQKAAKALGKLVPANEIPVIAAERLGYRCRRCGSSSSAQACVCPNCGADKWKGCTSPFDDLVFSPGGVVREARVFTTREKEDGGEEVVVYERAEAGKVRILTNAELTLLESLRINRPRKIILPLTRSPFVQATGASETELLGDVQHDP
jgi:ATP-dependent Lon protease